MVVVDELERLERRVSWMPGAEGAPLEREEEGFWRFVVDVAWPEAGTMRSALDGGLVMKKLWRRQWVCAGAQLEKEGLSPLWSDGIDVL